jgi:nitric oxide synthase-interacting protein
MPSTGPSTFLTNKERQRASIYGTQKVRLTKDAQRKFDQCNLCLNNLVDPVTSPCGFLYCRECILTNLLEQNKVLKLELINFEKQKSALEMQAAMLAQEEHEKKVEEFCEQEMRGPRSKDSDVQKQGSSSLQLSEADALKKIATKVDLRTTEEIIADATKTSFWKQDSSKDALATKSHDSIKPPDPAPRDPMSGKFLRMKQLVQVNFTPTVDSEDSLYMCPLCSKSLTVQKSVALSKCGHVFCDACIQKFVLPAKSCASCSTPTKGDHFIPLQQGGTSFSAHGGTQMEASVYTPALM